MKYKTGLLFILLILANCGFAQKAPKATAIDRSGSFWDIPDLTKAFITTSPSKQKDGISVGKLGAKRVNTEMILKLAQEIAENKHGEYDSFLIAHKGKLIFESYYMHGRVDLPHPQASTTKAYTSLALGRAIQLGYLSMDDLDKPVVSFLKDLDPTAFVDGVEKITLHKALSMRGGIKIKEETRKKFEKDTIRLKGQGMIQTVLSHSAPITSDSQGFDYGNYNPNLVMQVIEAVVPGTAEDFIKKELFDKMGVTNYRWATGLSGLPRAGSSSSITSRDMIKLGTLVMNKGKWKGKRLIPKAYISKMTDRVVPLTEEQAFFNGENISDPGYGYFWWQADMKVGNKTYFTTSGQGGGGQYLIVIKELDLIVVVTAHSRENDTMQITATRVLPAFVK